MNQSLLIGAKQAAQQLGIGQSLFYELKSQGRLPLPIRLGRRVLWRTDELARWVQAGCPTVERWQQMKQGGANV